MLMLGDVLAVVATLAGVCLSAWALVMAFSTLFPTKVEEARDAVSGQPWKCFRWGLGLWLTAGTASVALLNAPNPLAKLVGWIVLLGLLTLAMLGAAGIAAVCARRVKALDPQASDLSAQTKGAVFVIVSGILPILGWFAVAPMVLMFGLGAGSRAVQAARLRKPVEVEATP